MPSVLREKWSLTISNDIDLLVVVRVPQQLPNPRAGAGPGQGRRGRHGGIRHTQARGSQAIEGGEERTLELKLISSEEFGVRTEELGVVSGPLQGQNSLSRLLLRMKNKQTISLFLPHYEMLLPCNYIYKVSCK